MATVTVGGNSGLSYNVNGRWVDSGSPEGLAYQRQMSAGYLANKNKQIDEETGLEKTKALIAINDQKSAANTALSAARTGAARGGGTRGMDRRVHRRRGASAFSSIGLLDAANTAATSKLVGGYFDQSAKNRKNQVQRDLNPFGLTA